MIKSGPEDVRHLLFQCQTALNLWKELRLEAVISEACYDERSGSVILETLLRRSEEATRGIRNFRTKETISIACWYLWWIRRKRTHGEEVPPLHRCKISILAMVANYAKMSKPVLQSLAPRWTRPEPRKIKLNVDASFHVDAGAGSTGAILRDFQGHMVAASCTYIPNISSAALAEAIAMKEGLILASRLGCNSIVAESDSMETIEACTGAESWWNESAAIYADIVDLASNIDSIAFQYIPRKANVVAHELANQGFLLKSNCNWDDDPPRFILSSLINDVTIDTA